MAALDAVRFPQYIDVPIDMHFSDSDYYSIPPWNAAIVRSVRSAGGRANAYIYPGNTHEFNTVDGWSPAGSVPGRETAMQRTLELFQ
jgi:dienelactone hydrolase